jgi:hypothetical protein
MDDEVEDLRQKLAASEGRVAILVEQNRILQRDRDTFAQQLRQMRVIVERLDRRFAEVIAEVAELKAERAVELQKEVAELTGQVPAPPPLNEAPKPPAGTSRTGKGKKGRNAHGRNTKPGYGLAVCPTDEGVERCEACGSDDLRVVETVEHKQWDYVCGHFRQRVHRCRTVRCNRCLGRTTAQPPAPPFPRASCTAPPAGARPVPEVRPVPPVGAPARRAPPPWGACPAVHPGRLGPPRARAVLGHRRGPVGPADGRRRAPLRRHLAQGPPWTREGPSRPHLRLRHGRDRGLQVPGDQARGAAAGDAGGVRRDGGGGRRARKQCSVRVRERVEGGCCSHAFRKFKDCLQHDPENASEGMGWLAAAVFRVEERAKELGLRGQPLLAYRKAHAAPLCAQFKSRLDIREAELLPQSSIGKAIGYCRDQWPNLMRFLTDPAVDPTNNAAERLLKPAALLRKNSVFAGSDAGADRGATMLTIVNTCRLIAVDAEAYIVWALDQMAERRVTRERLAELGGGPAPPIRYDDLTPAAYKAMLARAAAVAARETPRPADAQPTA